MWFRKKSLEMPHVEVAPQVLLPLLGYGTHRLEGEKCFELVYHALTMGVRHIDTAEHYRNHRAVGAALRESRVPRREVFLTTKLWWNHLRREQVLAHARKFLEELSVDYVDLLLVHWPNRTVPFQETFSALEELRHEGVIRTYGVSNFTPHHLEEVQALGFRPAINQVEIHPTFRQEALVTWCREKGVEPVAHSPFGGGNDLALYELRRIAHAMFATPAQAVLAWFRWKEIPVLFGTNNLSSLEENIASLSLPLDVARLKEIDALPEKSRQLNPPYADFTY